jgi:hypothetical protein
MSTNRLDGPWGRRNVPLGDVVLTLEQKNWLIYEVVHHGVEAKVLTNKHSLSVPTNSKVTAFDEK